VPRAQTRITRRRAILLAALAATAALSPVAAPAHSQLVRSEPGRNVTVTRPPERVRLWFSERIEPAYATLSVWSEAGKQVDARDAAVDSNDQTLLSVSTPNLGPGRYTARFRVLSVDGHIVESSFAFTVKALAR
jgi:methionine-rich copper-binding protein CopC